MKIVFISHSASFTGAPILLLNLIKLLKETGQYEITVLLKENGPLRADFASVAETFIWNEKVKEVKKTTTLQRILNKYNYARIENKRKANILNQVKKSDVIINNTITNGELLEIVIKEYKGKVISYIHEMKMATFKFATIKGITLTLNLSDRFITPSIAVKLFLEKECKILANSIFILNSFIPEMKNLIEDVEEKKQEKRFTIGACGTLDWTKGVDIFICVARYMMTMNLNNEFAFIWKGGNLNRENYKRIIYDIEKSGLQEIITIIPADEKMTSFYNSIDVFFLPSREDSYPLVVLEAASFGKPTICFNGAGGAQEFVQEDAGSVVPYLDIEALADEILKYMQDPKLLKQKGNVARLRVEELHQKKSLILEQFNELIK